MKRRRVHAAVAFGLLGIALDAACARHAAPPSEDALSGPPPAAAVAPLAAVPSDAAAVEPITRLALPIAAFHTTIVAGDDDDAYLLTSRGAHRLPPGRAPVEVPLDLGFGATATRSAFVHWSRGALVKTPKAGGPARRLVALAAPPQALVASEDRVAWLERSDDGRSSLRALSGKKAITVYRSGGSIDAIAMLDGWLIFVERPAGADWRIGRVHAGGGEATFTALRPGRAPAMLAARRDIYYYEGNSRQVRRFSPDLQREQALASDFVCSPIAVAEQVYCAQVEGIFELRAGDRPRRLVPGSEARMVTEIAATPKRLLWVVDAGADKLEVRELPLAR